MNVDVARQRIRTALDELNKSRPQVEKRERYDRGEHDLPFAPVGVNEEYLDLRKQAVANWIALAVGAPVQRLRGESFSTHKSDDLDKALWRDVWQRNKLDARQQNPYQDMMKHGRGLMSVWPNKANRSQPIVRPESNELVYLHPSDDDPFTHDWTVKVWTVNDYSAATGQLILPFGLSGTTRTIAVVYDDEGMLRLERGGRTGSAIFEVTNEGTHPMGENPFQPFDYRPDSRGQVRSPMDPLIPQQDAINTIRFNTLLAMQFSAFRQRAVSGFDPVVRDKDGAPVYRKNGDESLFLDGDGLPVPVLATPGRVGVDRMLVFPGEATRVFDLPESNLDNYIKVLGEFLTQFFATGQIPPQYLLSRMSNLSGDALAGAESTLAALVKEIQLIGAEGNEGIFRRGAKCMGLDSDFPDAEMNYADAEAKSFAQIVDGIVKLIGSGFPKRDAWKMLPGATNQKVDTWIEHAEDEVWDNQMARAARSFQDSTAPAPVNDQTEVTDDAPTGGD